jgi:hypothetical protein
MLPLGPLREIMTLLVPGRASRSTCEPSRATGTGADLSNPPQSGLGEGDWSRPASRATGAARVEAERANEAIRRGEAGIFILVIGVRV